MLFETNRIWRLYGQTNKTNIHNRTVENNATYQKEGGNHHLGESSYPSYCFSFVWIKVTDSFHCGHVLQQRLFNISPHDMLLKIYIYINVKSKRCMLMLWLILPFLQNTTYYTNFKHYPFSYISPDPLFLLFWNMHTLKSYWFSLILNSSWILSGSDFLLPYTWLVLF